MLKIDTKEFCQSLVKACKRFPWMVALALFNTAMLIVITEYDNYQTPQSFLFGLYTLGMTGFLGFPTLLALILFCERLGIVRLKKAFVVCIGIFLLCVYGYHLHSSYDVDAETFPLAMVLQYVSLAFALHFLMAFLPVWRLGRKEFWHFNAYLFLNFIISQFYSHLICAGIEFVLLMLEHLFDIDINWRLNLYPWYVTSIFVSTILFLMRIPSVRDGGELRGLVIKGLRILSQYILAPFVAIYFLIMYAFEAKILVTGMWPEGWIGYLVAWVSVAAILTALFLDPYQEDEAQTKLRVVIRTFFVGLLPLAVLLAASLYKRVNGYGWTESRYFLGILDLWICGLSLYFLVKKKGDIRVIPISLFVVSLLVSFGPLSAKDISLKSQQARLGRILHESNIERLDDFFREDNPKKSRDYGINTEFYKVGRYLIEHHGESAFKKWLAMPVASSSLRSFFGQYNQNFEYQRAVTRFMRSQVNDSAFFEGRDYVVCDSEGTATYTSKVYCEKTKDEGVTFYRDGKKLFTLSLLDLAASLDEKHWRNTSSYYYGPPYSLQAGLVHLEFAGGQATVLVRSLKYHVKPKWAIDNYTLIAIIEN